jgi:plastocyanin
MDRRAFLAAGAGAGSALALAGCIGGLSDDDFDIGMSQNAFLPDEHEVSVGDRVVWGNNSSRGHTVTAYETLPDGADYFASGGFSDAESAREAWYSGGNGNIAPGETYEHTFEVPGRHEYFCIPHESSGMVGVIVVTG